MSDTNRPSSPTQVAHRFGCSCGCISNYPYALWRKHQGEDVFMGIMIMMLNDDGEMRKLDDPANTAGPGHVMSDEEFLTECAQYDDGPTDLNLKAINLMDFSSRPSDFVDSNDDVFNVRYPFGSSVPQVRAGDLVKIVAWIDRPRSVCVVCPGKAPASTSLKRCSGCKKVLYCSLQCQEFHWGAHHKKVCKYLGDSGGNAHVLPDLHPMGSERFWAEVVSVTSTGIVTAASRADLNLVALRSGDLFSFPITRVLGVEHGDNWASPSP